MPHGGHAAQTGQESWDQLLVTNQLYIPLRSLHSVSDTGIFHIPTFKRKWYGQRTLSYSATTTWNTLLCQTPASSIKCHRNLAQISDSKISVLTEIHQSLTKAQPHAFVFFSLHKNDPCWSSVNSILDTNRKIWSLTGHWKSFKCFSLYIYLSFHNKLAWIQIANLYTGNHYKFACANEALWITFLLRFCFQKCRVLSLSLSRPRSPHSKDTPGCTNPFSDWKKEEYSRGWNNDQYIQVLPNVVPTYKSEAESAF